MPQIDINTGNVGVFNFNVTIDIYDRTITFDTSNTTYQGSGISAILGISFSFLDSDGVELAGIDFSTPGKYIVPSITQVFTLDLSSVNYAFLFQTYQITGAIKDSNGTVYQTVPVYKNVCQPIGFTDSGYVPGIFQVSADCVNNNITVKELTVLTYNNSQPTTVVKTGTFYYPTGTISAINFTGTPFSNNVVYTGQYKIYCGTVGTYDLYDGVYVEVTFITNSVFDVTCTDKMSDLICCIQQVQNTAQKNCDNAVGSHAKNQLAEISPYLLTGLLKEINGQDSELEASFIKKYLNCNCGITSIGQNEVTPVNPSVYNIVIQGAGDVTTYASTTGSTKTYTITSKLYQVVKGNTGDLAFTISLDTSVLNTVKYVITFNYTVMAGYILTAIGNSPSLINQLNALINSSGVNIIGLNGRCIIDTSTTNYVFTQSGLSSSTGIVNIVINGTTYNSPTLFANNPSGIQTWLNSLSLGTFSVSYNTGTLSITSLNNANTVSTFTVSNPSLTIQFQASNKTLVQVLQAIIDYLCQITALEVALGNALTLCSMDYNGNTTTLNFGATQSQAAFNAGVTSTICNIINRINNLTGITCAKIAALFPDSLSSNFSGNSRVYGNDGLNCVGFTNKQVALGVISAINSFSDVKTAYCAINCGTPASCPDVTNINASIISGNIGIYGITWTQNPVASQLATVKYRVTGTTTWIVATNSLGVLPNGNLSGTTPFLITGLTPGSTYDLNVVNNCGGVGFIKQITVPTSTVYSGSYLLDTIIYNICGDSPVTLYSSSPFAPGVVMYTNIELTVPVTGYTYISSSSSGNIFHLNSSTGIVGADTGSSCTAGTAGSYILGNSTGSICSGSPVVKYTNGAFAVGSTLYNDHSLINPVTGNAYVVNLANNRIYNLNSSTGVIGSDTGLSCTTSATVNISSTGGSSITISNVKVNGIGVSLSIGSYPIAPGNNGSGTTSQIGTFVVEVDQTTTLGGQNIVIQDSAGNIQCADVNSSVPVLFTGVIINASAPINITASNGACA